MAFNPFRAFRKHQKVLFVAVTVMCMVTFVLCGSFGSKADYFFTEMLAPIFGRGATALYYTGAILLVAALICLLIGLRKTEKAWALYLGAIGAFLFAGFFFIIGISRASREEASRVLSLYGEPVQLQDLERVREQRRIAEEYLFGVTYPSVEQQIRQIFGKMDPRQVENQVAQLASGETSRQVSRQLYAGGSLRLEDLLDFMIWRRQADRLGIQLTRNDIDSEIKRLSFPADADLARIERLVLNNHRGLTSDRLYTALGDELRVRLALTALLGSQQVSAPTTPFDFWKYYQDQRTTLDIALLPIQVKDFPVRDKPTEQELQTLFERYRNREPLPTSDEPGFKEPQRVQVAWVGGKVDAPFYRKAIQDSMLSMLAAAPTNPTLAVALTVDFLHQYERQKFQYRLPAWNEPDFSLAFVINPHRPENLAATLGLFLVTVATQGAALTVEVGYPSTVVARESKTTEAALAGETRERLTTGCTLLLTSGTAPLTAATVALQADKDRYLPLELVKDQLLEQMQSTKARDLLVDNLIKLQESIKAVGSKPESERKKAADEALAKAVQEYGLTQHGSTEKPEDQYSIGDDKGLAAFKEIYINSPNSSGDKKGERFFTLFFPQPPSQSMPQAAPPAVAVFTPQPWPSDQRTQPGDLKNNQNWKFSMEPILFWKSEEKKAFVPTFEVARSKVEDAWRLRKERELAREKANEVAKQAQATAGDLAKLRDLSAALKLDLIGPDTLKPVARQLPPEKSPAPVTERQYDSYKFPEVIKYPRSGQWLDELLKLEKPGDTAVLSDLPKKTYYVAVLIRRTPRSAEGFYAAYKEAPRDATPRDPLFDQFEQQQLEDYRRKVMEELRVEAGVPLLDAQHPQPVALDDKRSYQIKEDIRKQLEGRTAEAEE